MAELIVVLVAVALVAAVAWLVTGPRARPRSPHDQPEVTRTDPVPPPDPSRPVPGSRPFRRRRGRP
ncbi:MAG TPA: hypothetical protein VFW63_05685 [Acidimicrobiales bacterium]|nr:hypothetical protein [Acidimicrobiales bacterium]